MVEFFTFTEASRGPPEASWLSGLWTAVRRLSTPALCGRLLPHFHLWKSKTRTWNPGLTLSKPETLV